MEILKLEEKLAGLRVTELTLIEKTKTLKEGLSLATEEEVKEKKIEIYDTREEMEDCKEAIRVITEELAERVKDQEKLWNPRKDDQVFGASQVEHESHLGGHQFTKMSDRVSYAKTIKPHKYKHGDDILIFFERFAQYVAVNRIVDPNLDILLLTLIEEDTMYKKIRAIKLTELQKSDERLMIQVLKDGLFPATESRILRSTVSRMKQTIGETIEHFTQKIEDAAERAFGNPILREEACLSALIEGVLDRDIKRRLMVDEISDFQTAVRMAKKLERIGQAVNDESRDSGLDISGMDGVVFNVEERGKQCSKCGKDGHEEGSCWKDVVCQLCERTGHVAKVCRQFTSQGSQGSFSRRPWRGPVTYRGRGRARGSRFYQ